MPDIPQLTPESVFGELIIIVLYAILCYNTLCYNEGWLYHTRKESTQDYYFIKNVFVYCGIFSIL